MNQAIKILETHSQDLKLPSYNQLLIAVDLVFMDAILCEIIIRLINYSRPIFFH
ncbi:hypothetical protein BY996DRAFT_6548164 [Phakopsora pachyrhizi]|uniref:Uncharacterized protein n=1 Tax=Phakopsora pachyrhizi TaxID=170000 RepID=A0AAV0BA22_PHAPC|nr:hypothetical protein BY996DRAFT_6548164 [Phakopsora pachyrhizi]CAH7682782.1 hypothetical protein PPACK8108_LOCUS15884 [Phakopsora pachyrhizi]